MPKRGEEEMAAKKIGAIIALDGEKEFRQNVTSCNKSLAAMKSEMGLVKAQCEGQENTLVALSKKHEVLTKILEEQKNKEEAVRVGLGHAKTSYEKIEEGLRTLNAEQQKHIQRTEELKSAYDNAVKELDEMKNSSEASKQEVKLQEEAVKSLSDELKKEETALRGVSEAISKGEKNYQTAGNRVKDWETKLNTAEAQVIKANSAVNKNAAYMREAEQATNQCATSIDEFGKEVKKAEEVTVDFGTVVKTNLSNTVVNAVKSAVSGAASSVTELENAQRQFQSSTGASTAEMKKYKSVMDEIHSNNFGNDIDDVARSMALVKQYTGELDSGKLRDMTKNGIAMRDVFDMDLSETIRGVDGLVKNMGVTSEEAFDLMAAGAQNGLNKSGELGDNIAEYSQLWGQAGFSAKEMFAIVDNGLQSGAYNLDKVNDFVKEFSISLADGRIEENMDSFSDGTKSLFYQWKAGKATTKDVFYSVINDLSKAENQQQALTLASNTWSALGEDNAMKVITSLDQVNHTFDNVKGTMEEINEVKYDTLEARFQQLGKKFQTKVAVPIVEEALPLMEEGLDLVIDHMDDFITVLGGVGAGVAVFKTGTKAIALYESVTKAAAVAQAAYTTTTEGATVAQTVFNTVCNTNPILLVVSALAVAGTAYAVFIKTSGEASNQVKELVEQNQRLCESANEVSDSAKELIASHKGNNAEMEAQAEYADSLADKIEKLAGKTGRSNEETEVMQEYIAELNQIVPDLNLAYDEQAESLNMTSEALEEYLDKSQKEIEMQAAREYAIELMKKKSELAIEEIKLENEAADIRGKNNEKEISNTTTLTALMTGLSSGNMDYYRSIKEVSEAQDENSEAIDNNKERQKNVQDEMEATRQYLETLGIDWKTVTDATNENTNAVGTNNDAMSSAAETNAASAQTITEAYVDMQGKVSEVLESQMNMFEEFNAGTEISSEQLLDNMQSQIEGVSNWADNMAVLAARGVDEGILNKLAEMGPQGSTYVQAFATMTDEQLQMANNMWSQSLDMKAGVNDSVQGMIEEYTIALNGGKERVAESMKSVGLEVSSGLGEGIRSGISNGTIAIDEVGQAVITSAKTKFDSHSPSKVFMGIGKDVTSGLTNGITGSQGQAVAVMESMSQQLVDTAQRVLNTADFARVGNNITAGIKSGIQSGSLYMMNAVNNMCQDARTRIQDGLRPSLFSPYGRSVSEGVANGITTGNRLVESSVNGLCDTVESEMDLDEYTLYWDGWNVSVGLANGISDGSSYVINAVANMCAAAVMTAEAYLDINSPSKVFEKIGGYTAEGFEVGYEDKMKEVNETIRRSMEIPATKQYTFDGKMGTHGESKTADAIGILQEYLPYLAILAQKDLTLYPSKRKFETEIARAADRGLETIRKRAERR